MIIQQLRHKHYERLHESLLESAQTEPFDASYTVNMKVNDVEYAVKIQPEINDKIAVTQALRTDWKEGVPIHKLVTKANVLSALLELLIDQCVS